MNQHFWFLTGVVVAFAAVAGEPEKKSPEFASTFDVDKANLTSTGKNSYFSLEPGHRLNFKGDNAMLRITVLHKTKMVDGVETRVVEEREEKDGKPTEVSMNYFAIDRTSNAVYYFGEDVDIYRNGKVVNHEGSWLSGVNGAKFGMMMPGKPKVGDKFQQEIAPKTAMDRCEIVAIGEEVKTPLGTFNDCLRTRDTSALEKGASEKVYAPGVGLVKDDEFVLVGVTKSIARKTSFKGWELYVWREKGDTYFSLLPGTNRLKTDEEINKTAVKGIDAIEAKLVELKPGEDVFVVGRKSMEPPPKDQAAPVVDYGKKLGLKVQVRHESMENDDGKGR